MLPWVLLYGFTALLFNHPTYMTDSKTEIENFSLPVKNTSDLPSARQIANQAIASAKLSLRDADSSQVIERTDSPNAVFTRQISGSVENDKQSVNVVMDLNSGNGYLRKRTKTMTEDPDTANKDIKSSPERDSVNLRDGLKLNVKCDPIQGFKDGVKELLSPHELDSKKLNLRRMPNIEFDAFVDGTLVRLRLAYEQDRNRSGKSETGEKPSDSNPQKSKPSYRSKLTIVGQNPREMNARSFLLRLHMAHGYGVQTNAKWFWAIAVDLMFASMCFWGLSGVVMWWQIKRTRKLGIILLAASAAVATWLAVGMHWQLANG